MSKTYYHVAGEGYEVGEPLLSHDRLCEAGVEVEWKWEDAPEGFDGHAVCVFEDRDEAEDFRSEFCPNGTILLITVSDEDLEDPMTWGTEYGYVFPRVTKVEEGYTAFEQGIPAEWIEVAR